MINADVTKSIELNAVKFNEIGLYFKSSNSTVQRKLDEELAYVEVKLTHLGDSYYRCADKFYIITHDQLPMHHYPISIDQKYMLENVVYIKIKRNLPIFSPYTMWKIQLQMSDIRKDVFYNLREYINAPIDLVLVGKGQCIRDDGNVCNNLRKYYKNI